MSVRLNFWKILDEQVVEMDVYHCTSGVGLPLLLRIPMQITRNLLSCGPLLFRQVVL
jgi:hypothetical protein